MMDEIFTLDGFVERCASRLLQQPPESWDHSDDDMNAKARMIPEGVRPKPAAVLIGVMPREAKLHVLLTQRHSGLANHAGQIAFPGGRMDAGEKPLDAALREAEEETGLARNFVTPLGFLDGYLTVTGYFVTPVVALLTEGYALSPQDGEVDDIFDVPLSFLMTAANRETHTREWKGLTRRYYAYPWQERYIWGATAGMIKNMSDRLYAPQD